MTHDYDVDCRADWRECDMRTIDAIRRESEPRPMRIVLVLALSATTGTIALSGLWQIWTWLSAWAKHMHQVLR